MTIAFQCEYCGRRYSSNPELSGKTIKCRQCDKPIRIPEPEPIPEREPVSFSKPASESILSISAAALGAESDAASDSRAHAPAPRYMPEVRPLREPASQQAREAWAGSTSFGVGCVGLLAWMIPILGLPITVVGLVLGGMGLNGPAKGKAAAGVVLSSVGLLLTFLAACASFYFLGYQGFTPVAR